MFYQQSPLETVASYAVTFAAGALSMGAVILYGHWMHRRGTRGTAPEVRP